MSKHIDIAGDTGLVDPQFIVPGPTSPVGPQSGGSDQPGPGKPGDNPGPGILPPVPGTPRPGDPPPEPTFPRPSTPSTPSPTSPPSGPPQPPSMGP